MSTRLWRLASRLRELKFKHSFQDSLNPIFSCVIDSKTSTHSFFTALVIWMKNKKITWISLETSMGPIPR